MQTTKKSPKQAIPVQTPNLQGVNREAVLSFKLEILQTVDAFLDANNASTALDFLQEMSISYFSSTAYTDQSRMQRRTSLSTYYTLRALFSDLALFEFEHKIRKSTTTPKLSPADYQKVLAILCP